MVEGIDHRLPKLIQPGTEEVELTVGRFLKKMALSKGERKGDGRGEITSEQRLPRKS